MLQTQPTPYQHGQKGVPLAKRSASRLIPYIPLPPINIGRGPFCSPLICRARNLTVIGRQGLTDAPHQIKPPMLHPGTNKTIMNASGFQTCEAVHPAAWSQRHNHSTKGYPTGLARWRPVLYFLDTE